MSPVAVRTRLAHGIVALLATLSLAVGLFGSGPRAIAPAFAQAAACAPTPAGLVSRWPGDGNANDAAGVNHGTLQNGATFAAGKVGQAFSLDGADDHVRVMDDPSLDFGTGNFTVDAWINVNGSLLVPDTEYGIVNKNVNFEKSPGWGMELSTYGSDSGKFSAQFYITGQTTWQNTNVRSGPNRLSGVWHHVAGVRQGTTTRFYFNGVLTAELTHPDAALNVDNGHPFLIGDHAWGPNFPGLIDEISVFNRALTADEIQAVFAAGSAGRCGPNQPPTANAGGPYGVPEGGSVALSGSGTDPDNDRLTFAWDLDNNGSFETAVQNPTFSAAGRDGPSSQTVVLRVCEDKTPALCATANTTVTITNVAPVVAVTGGPASSPEGTPISLGSTVVDPGANETFTYAWGVTKNGEPFGAPGAAATFSATPDDDGTYVVTLTVTDDDGGSGSANTTITGTNVAPTATFTATSPITEGGTSTASLSGAADPGTVDTQAGFRYAFACDNAALSGATYATSGASAATPCSFADNGAYPVRGRIIDKDDGYSEYTSVVHVTNAPPTITSVTNNGPIDAGASATITVAATDPAGPEDPLRYEFDCNNDGTYEIGPQSGNAATCAFPAAGEYPVRVRVTDGDGGAATGVTTVTVRPAPGADLAVTKRATPASVRVGSDLTYTVVVTNNGPLPATGTTVTDTLTGAVDELRLRGATLSDPPPDCAVTSASGSGLTVRCALGDLARGASVTFQVIVAPRAAGSLQNTVNVASTVADPNPANNAAAVDTTVTRR